MSTALLAEARLQQLTYTQSPSTTSKWAVRDAHATAIARFVTGFCDAVLPARNISSMYQMAAFLGMPAAWVDVRHDITHGHMPELRALEALVEPALRWLWRGFWVHFCAAEERGADGEAGQVPEEKVDEAEAVDWLCRILEPGSPWQRVVELGVRNERTRVAWIELLLMQSTPAALRAAKILIKRCDRQFQNDWRPLCEAASGVDAEDWGSEDLSDDDGLDDSDVERDEDQDADMKDVDESVVALPKLKTESRLSSLRAIVDMEADPPLERRRGGWRVDSSYPSISGEEGKLWADSKIGEVV